MQATPIYQLPTLVGGQYVYISVLTETEDTVLYSARQKDMQREVVVETLRPGLMGDVNKVQAFLEKARAQARLGGGSIASCLELLFADGTWHLAKERIDGTPLDIMVAEGSTLPASELCDLMQLLCRICIGMDIEGIAGAPFLLQNLYYMAPGFRLRNPAVGGPRGRSSSRRVLTSAAAELLKLLDLSSPFASELGNVLSRMSFPSNWTSLSPVLYNEELARLQQLFFCGVPEPSPPQPSEEESSAS